MVYVCSVCRVCVCRVMFVLCSGGECYRVLKCCVCMPGRCSVYNEAPVCAEEGRPQHEQLSTREDKSSDFLLNVFRCSVPVAMASV